MTSYRKNLMVGLVVIGALIILGWMILKFGDKPAMLFARPRIPVKFIAERADGVGEGSQITFRGVQVGQVTGSHLINDGSKVQIDTLIDKPPALPANVHGEIKAGSFLGGNANLELVFDNPQPKGELQANATLRADYVGMSLIPPEIGDLAKEMRETVRQFRESGLIKHLDETIIATHTQLQRAGDVIDSLQKIVGDPQMRSDLKTSLASIRDASADLKKFTANLHDLSANVNGTITDARGAINKTQQKVSDRLDQLAGIMTNINTMTARINQGQGTVGKLMNDPKLYESLLDTAKELKTTVADLSRLIEQWEQEGVYLNLGGKK